MTLSREIKLKDCGSSWCDQYVGCVGHIITASYTTVTDVGSVYIDGDLAFAGGDNILQAVADIINDLWADKPKFVAPKPQDRSSNADQ